MKNKERSVQFWHGKSIRVKILYSRAGVAQHIWIENEKGGILVDAGDGIIRDLLSSKIDLEELKGVIFTHGHFDHMGGLHSLLGFLRMVGRKRTLLVFTPKGCTEVFSILDNFIRCYPSTIPFKITCNEVPPNRVFQIAGMKIKPYPMIHCGGIEGQEILNQIPALGYRITYKGETVAISGDTGFCSSLRELVKGADLAILEATYSKGKKVKKEFLERVHLSEDLANEIGKSAKDFILVHKGKRKN
jgi:ribonuclease Z